MSAAARTLQRSVCLVRYTLVNGRPPAEADMMRFFRVTPPTVHQMVLALEWAGLISRQPGVTRNIVSCSTAPPCPNWSPLFTPKVLDGLSCTTHPATEPAPCGESLSFRKAGRHDRFAHRAFRQAEASPTIDRCCRRSDHRSNRLTRYPGRPVISPTRSFGRNSADAVEGPSSTRPSRRPIAGS
jgi:hypothetical protein